MPFYGPKQEVAKPRPEVIEEEGIVNVELNATADSEDEPEVSMTAMSASEFLAELERLPTLRVSPNSQSLQGNLSTGTFDIQGGEAIREYGEASENPIRSLLVETPSPGSPSGSWDSEFGDLSCPSEDCFWNSYIPYESADPLFCEQSSRHDSERLHRVLADLWESTDHSTDLQACSHGEDCEHDPYIGCSQRCTCTQTVEVSMDRVLQLLNEGGINSAAAASAGEGMIEEGELREESGQFVS